MLDFKTMGALAGLLKNRDKLEAVARRIRDELAATEVIGEAGGGAARVTVGGDLKVRAVALEPAVAQGLGADEQSRTMAQQLIAEATNDGLVRAQQAAREIVQREMAELGLPDLAGQLGGLGGLLP